MLFAEVFLHRFAVIGTTTERAWGSPINFTMDSTFSCEISLIKAIHDLIAGYPLLIIMAQAHRAFFSFSLSL